MSETDDKLSSDLVQCLPATIRPHKKDIINMVRGTILILGGN